jgi:hypothetical protein
VKYREVFNADTCGELVVDDAVEDGGNDANEHYLQGFHRQAPFYVSAMAKVLP